ncbi:hypothetical protein GCM10029963_72980 [Micromonospora andamanensis]
MTFTDQLVSGGTGSGQQRHEIRSEFHVLVRVVFDVGQVIPVQRTVGSVFDPGVARAVVGGWALVGGAYNVAARRVGVGALAFKCRTWVCWSGVTWLRRLLHRRWGGWCGRCCGRCRRCLLGFAAAGGQFYQGDRRDDDQSVHGEGRR